MSLVQPLLVDFVVVLPGEISHGLPLMRDVQQCINFLFESSILKKFAYLMNPKEYEELHRKVNELIEKGVDIRECDSLHRNHLVSIETWRWFFECALIVEL